MSEQSAKVSDLLHDLDNPRYAGLDSTRKAIQTIFEDQGKKLVALADDIVTSGLDPTSRILVIPAPDADKFIVVDGNRRLTALKLLSSPTLIDSFGTVNESLRKQFHKLAKEFNRVDFETVPVWVCENRDEANRWIDLKHTGENDGRGLVGWDGIATARFRGKSQSLKVLEFVKQHGSLSPEDASGLDRFHVTNLDRLLGTPEVRTALGLEFKDGDVVSQYPKAELARVLSKVVGDISSRRVRVSHIKGKDDRIRYISNWSADERPNPKKLTSMVLPLDAIGKATTVVAAKKVPSTRSNAKLDRSTIIPSTCKLTIDIPKIREIYLELRKLHLDSTPNAISVLMRVFLELTLDHYGDTRISQWTEGDKLSRKVEKVADALVSGGHKKNDIASFRRISSAESSTFHVDRLHKFVHNRKALPSATELRKGWDEVQFVFEAIWS